MSIGLAPRKPGQQAGRFQRQDHPHGLGFVDRRGSVDDVAEQLHRHAAEAQHHDRAEGSGSLTMPMTSSWPLGAMRCHQDAVDVASGA